jgi:transcriptional regulator with XRE-family HTH domain
VGQVTIGPLLVRLRKERGWSQKRVADLLNDASGNPTMTKNEVSRWERETRLPTTRWLPSLSVVLDIPLRELERAVHMTRRGASEQSDSEVWTSDSTEALSEFINDINGDLTPDTALRLADDWRTAQPPQVVEVRSGRRVGGRLAQTVRERTDELRRMDDYLAGGDMHDLVVRELRATVQLVRDASYTAATGRHLLVAVGELCQLAGWVTSDAGRHEEAERYYLGGVRPAHAAGDAALAANLLSSLSYQVANVGDRREAVLLAGAAYGGAKGSAPDTVCALLLERVAYANARFGDARATDRALGMAEDAYNGRDRSEDPEWVYWLDRDEIQVMAGRCCTELHRPALAEPLLSAVVDRYDASRAREKALYLSWLSEAHLYAGEVDAAADVATQVAQLSATVTSARSVDRVRHLARLLIPHQASRPVQLFLDLAPDVR